VCPRARLDTEVRGKLSCLCRGSKLDSPVVQSVARHHTELPRLLKTVVEQLKRTLNLLSGKAIGLLFSAQFLSVTNIQYKNTSV
jgi:hypothetical protein